MKIFFVSIAIIITAFIFSGGLNKDSYRMSGLDNDTNIKRQVYLGESLGRYYSNRIGVYYFNKVYPLQSKFEYTFFSSLKSIFIFIPLYGLIFYLGVNKKT